MRTNKNSTYIFILALTLGTTLAVGATVLATSIGNNISATGTLSATGALSVTTTSATSTLSTGGLTVGTNQFVVQQNSGYAGIGTTSPWGLLSINPNNISGPAFAIGSTTGSTYLTVTNGGNVGIGTTSPAQLLSVTGSGYVTNGLGIGIATTTAGSLETTGAGLIAGAFNVGGAARFNSTANFGSTATFGSSGTAVNSIIFGFCDFGPIVASQSILATSTGTVACTSQIPSGLAAGDKVWLTASTSVASIGTGGLNYVYTGVASATSATRIQAIIYNVAGTAYTVTTSTWQYFIIK